MSKINDTQRFKRLLKRTRALKTAMESAKAADTPDSGKWYASVAFMQEYSKISRAYIHYIGKNEGPNSVVVIDDSKLKSPSDYTWPRLKQLFDMAYMHVLTLEALLSENEINEYDELSEYEHFFSGNLRRTFNAPPDNEKQVQDNMESLLIGKGLRKPNDYDRESGRSKSSGKEYIPDFIIKRPLVCLLYTSPSPRDRG